MFPWNIIANIINSEFRGLVKINKTHGAIPSFIRTFSILQVRDLWPSAIKNPPEMLAKTQLCTNCLIISTASFVFHYTMVTGAAVKNSFWLLHLYSGALCAGKVYRAEQYQISTSLCRSLKFFVALDTKADTNQS